MEQKKLSLSDNISFVIPAYNCADTVQESVESIIQGNWNEKDEVILIDDGSNDETPRVLEKLKQKYPFINVITQKENQGCPAARNIGYAAARHPIIFNLYSDDVLVPGSVSKLKSYMIGENADMAGFAEYHYFREEKKGKKKITHKWICRPGLLTLLISSQETSILGQVETTCSPRLAGSPSAVFGNTEKACMKPGALH
jgi:glycosyltransferase involved in cell wall biosynthesis